LLWKKICSIETCERSGTTSSVLIEQVESRMSEYRRNKGMVACIIAVIAGGALTVGALTYFGSTGWWWFPGWNTAKTVFPFEHEVGNTTGTVTLDVNLGAGGVVIRFEENTTLLYRMTVEVQNSTLETHGAPVVVLASNVIGLNYTAAGVNLTLGTGVNYTIDVTTSAGAVSITLDHGTHIGNMSMTTTAGAISVIMGDDVQILGDSIFDLETSAGAISVYLDLPVGVGGSFEASTTVGPVTVTQVGWNQITTRHYETDNYDTAETTLTIVAQAATGAISANLS
jgi:hypothetical protein